MKKTIEINPKVNVFDPNSKPIESEDDKMLSVDVCCIDEEGLHNLGYYNFEENKWKFHTDTLVDYFEKGNETKWWWYYPVVTKKVIEQF